MVEPIPITEICLNVTDNCNLSCHLCVKGDTKILMADFTEKNIEDIQIGDKILGTNEEVLEKKTYRKLLAQGVTETFKRTVEHLLKITMEDGRELFITEEHPVLNGRNKWTSAKNLREKTGAIRSLNLDLTGIDNTNIYNESYMEGYIIGAFMGDGYYRAYLKGDKKKFAMAIGVTDYEIIDRLEDYLKKFNLTYGISYRQPREQDKVVKVLSSYNEQMYDFLLDLEYRLYMIKDDRNFAKGFLAGIYDTEGHIDKESRYVSIYNTNIFLLEMFDKCLKIIGLNGKVDYEKKPDENYLIKGKYKGKKVCYRYSIPTNNQNNNLKFLLLVKPSLERKSYSNFYGGTYFNNAKIEKIEKIYETTNVYNLETTEHTYIANGLVVHNCFVQQKPNNISYKTAEDTMEWLLENAIKREKMEGKYKKPYCGFFGGEPLLVWEEVIVPIVEKYYQDISFGITTNGTLLTEDRLKFLKDHNVSVLFSCDGDRESQEKNRPCKDGSSSFDKIKNIIPLIPKYFPNTTFRSTISKWSCDKIMHNINFAKENGFRNMFLIPNFFETEWTKEELATISIQMRTYSLYFIDSFRKDEAPFEIYPLQQAFYKIHRLLFHQENNSVAKSSLKKCGLGAGGYAGVNYKGEIFSCQELNSREFSNDLFYIGNIYSGVEPSRVQNIIDEFLSKNFSSPFCEKCKLKLTCANENCIINNFILTGDIHKSNPIICWWFNLLVEEALFICKVLGENKNEKFKKYFQEMRELYSDRNS